MEVLAVMVAAVGGFVGGLLVGRKHVAKVEQVVADVKDAVAKVEVPPNTPAAPPKA